MSVLGRLTSIFCVLGEQNKSQVLDLANDLFSASDFPPNYAVVDLADHGKQRRVRVKEDWRDLIDLNRFDSIQIYHLDRLTKINLRDFRATLLIRRSACESSSFDMHVFVEGEHVESSVLAIKKHFSRPGWLPARGVYGYCTSFELEDWPDAYALGVTKSNQGRVAMERNTAWLTDMNSARLFRTSIIRDVYECNLLSQNHLDVVLKKSRLRFGDWLELAPHRGIVQTLAEQQVIWVIPPLEVGRVREELLHEGMLVFDKP